MKSLKGVYFIAILGLVGVLASVCLYFKDNNCANLIGSLSTIISILLGVVSIAYTYVSGQKTIDAIQQINDHHALFVEKINSDLAKGNMDEENLKNIRDSMNDPIPPVGIKHT